MSGDIEGIPEHKEAVIIAQIKDKDDVGSQGDSFKIATAVDENGRWILSVADSRTADGLAYFEYTSEDNLYIDVLTTFSTITHEESIQGISERDIEISLEGSEVVGHTKVNLLDNYGVLGYSTRTILGIDDGGSLDSEYTVDEGVETPKTGVFDSSFLSPSGSN